MDIVFILTAFLQHLIVSKHFHIHSVRCVSEYDPRYRAVYQLVLLYVNFMFILAGNTDMWSNFILDGLRVSFG